jgi:threonyl-tRNA synthetase
VFWHSSAHVLGEAAERHYGCHLCLGPPTDDGFFYEMGIEERPVVNGDYPALEKLAESAVKDKQKFERLVVKKEKLLEMFNVGPILNPLSRCTQTFFQYNKYKQYLIDSKIPDGTSTTVYRCGPMIDLCVGPHIPHTGKIKAFMVTKVFLDDLYLPTVNKIFQRIPLLISSEIPPRSLSNVFMVSHSLTRNSLPSTRPSSLRLQSVTIER